MIQLCLPDQSCSEKDENRNIHPFVMQNIKKLSRTYLIQQSILKQLVDEAMNNTQPGRLSFATYNWKTPYLTRRKTSKAKTLFVVNIWIFVKSSYPAVNSRLPLGSPLQHNQPGSATSHVCSCVHAILLWRLVRTFYYQTCYPHVTDGDVYETSTPRCTINRNTRLDVQQPSERFSVPLHAWETGPGILPS